MNAISRKPEVHEILDQDARADFEAAARARWLRRCAFRRAGGAQCLERHVAGGSALCSATGVWRGGANQGGGRDQWAIRWLEHGWWDLRLSFRSLWRSPVFGLAVVATLALCIVERVSQHAGAEALLAKFGGDIPGGLRGWHTGCSYGMGLMRRSSLRRGGGGTTAGSSVLAHAILNPSLAAASAKRWSLVRKLMPPGS